LVLCFAEGLPRITHMELEKNRRILVVDDNITIHADFQKILAPNSPTSQLDAGEAALWGQRPVKTWANFSLSFASQGKQAVEIVQTAFGTGLRYSVVFMDVRMPPGMDGVETSVELWKIDPDLQIVICTAYSDKSWEEMMEAVPNPERLLILKKPFDAIEVLQLAHALTEKWALLQSFRQNLDDTERAVEARTQELQASEERFRQLSAQAPIGIFETDAAGLCTYSNPHLQKLMGLSLAQTLGEGWMKSIYPDDSEEVHSFWKTVVRESRESQHEFRLRTPDGVIRWVYLRSALLRSGTGATTGYVASVEDINERKRADDQIAEQASFLDKAQDAIIARDLGGKVLFWNKGAERMYGWSRQEVVGQNLDGFLYTDPKRFEEVIDLTIAKGEWSGELQHLTQKKQEIIVEARWTLIRDNEGNPRSLLAINTDITEKKKLEAQFLRTQRMESIGTLAGGIAHDLNNILAPIMMSIDLLKATAHDPESKGILNTIAVSAKRGSDIVRQVLSFSRGIEGARVEVQPKHLLKDLEAIIKSTFPKDILLHFSVSENTWAILGDPTQVQQVLLNLSVNARDAMPHGGNLTIRVENCRLDKQYVALHPEAKAGAYVKIIIADEGTGIPPKVQEKIFEPFFTTKELGKGTGLGLSTVMAIVRSHEGIIDVSSVQGKGTTFTVFLPATEASLAGEIVRSGSVAVPIGNGETVLVIDDETSLLTVTSLTLRASGYRVLTANDGAEGVAIYTQHRNEIAAVVTDMMMPVMAGPATIKALIKINPAVKIIAVSGLKDDVTGTKVSVSGVKHFLTKPYPSMDLLKTLRLILDEK
jgi:PAS domain S-box-containing protein